MSLKWLDKLIERAKELEEQGRRIAFERDEPISSVDVDWLWDIDSTSFEIGRALRDLLPEEEWRKWFSFTSSIGAVARRLDVAITEGRAEGLARKDFKLKEFYKDFMREMDENYEKLTGRRCTWLLNVVEPYAYSAAVNDVTACFHRAIEKAEEVRGGWRIEGKCAWRR